MCRVELSVHRVDVDGDALTVDPVGELAERDVCGGILRAHARGMSLAGLSIDELEVVLHPLDAGGVGERPAP